MYTTIAVAKTDMRTATFLTALNMLNLLPLFFTLFTFINNTPEYLFYQAREIKTGESRYLRQQTRLGHTGNRIDLKHIWISFTVDPQIDPCGAFTFYSTMSGQRVAFAFS
jgi:hypothetical protein